MNGKLTAIAVMAATAATLATVAGAGAGAVATKQHVAIEEKAGAFVLTPLGAGALKSDVGTATFCCWTTRHVVRDGQTIDVDNPEMTLTGKHGTLVARNRIEWGDIPDGQSVFAGTWKVVRGTGAYAGLSGGGRVAGLTLANSSAKSRFIGVLSTK
jgi:hypothetical protein